MLSKWAGAFETAVMSEKPTVPQLLEAHDAFLMLTNLHNSPYKKFKDKVKQTVLRTVKRIFRRKMFRTSATLFLCMKRAYNVPRDIIKIIVKLDQEHTREKLGPFIGRLCCSNSTRVKTTTDLSDLWKTIRLGMELN